ncbi:hypothetical protein ATE68_22115 [Sphingopyxis sp. H038]|nr:hypothetical protein ATE78_06140 [Sphingopyxis sp. H012]KTE04912.1 hypothetical protein ATE76_22670 [Sphingopyxis sp. H093]KTE10284.1 hypothetical protein ATE70_10385 [Sphingopyxis sp. H053]KTE23247.1 hypothetical protein ATE75_19850 [Sphingopyxis sp. H080]KTE31362.1 hypothetical protein ATE68_22115 [Sphingopyxis sp. H038]KTE37700.1 hypothetical protein ATE73_21470 [Sphingopyxis sp. H077]KTE38523.1 hypothetical protein ATE77_23025 [Sphingopyxis sp. H005]
MSFRRLPFSPQCPAMVAWRTRKAAGAAKSILVQLNKFRYAPHKDRRRKIALLQPYQCDRCGKWHIGDPVPGWKQL